MKKKMLCTVAGALALVGCDQEPSGLGDSEGNAPEGQVSQDEEMITLRSARIENGKPVFGPSRLVSKSTLLKMNANRAAREQARAEGKQTDPALNQVLATVEDTFCGDDTLWLNDGPNQVPATERICLTSDGSSNAEPFELWASVTECATSDPLRFYKVESYWGGLLKFQLFSRMWDPDCQSTGDTTIASGCGFGARNDNLTTTPALAVVFNEGC